MINARAEALRLIIVQIVGLKFPRPTVARIKPPKDRDRLLWVVFTTAVHTIPNMLASSVVRRSVASLNKTTLRSLSVWSAVPAGPPDPILGMPDSSHASQYPSRSTNVSCHL